MEQEPVVSSTNSRFMPAQVTPITDDEFNTFRGMIFDLAGIHMSEAKKALVAGRLLKRLRHYSLKSYAEYLEIVQKDEEESQIMVNQLTTNETYFFREPKHYEYLTNNILPEYKDKHDFRLWSAAASSGEEAYTIAMVLSEFFGLKGWSIFGSDINEDVLEDAAQGVYPLEESENISPELLKKYCLKGVRSMQGYFTITPEIKKNISFARVNLNTTLPPEIPEFDTIFLRNVMIYFNRETKMQIIDRLIDKIRGNGYLIVGHAESLHGLTDRVKLQSPTIYKKI